MDKIQDLKRKHYNVKEVLKERIKAGKDVKDKVKEYLDICDQLRSAGIEVNDSSPRVIEALKQCGIDQQYSVSQNLPQKSIFQITLPPPPEQPKTNESLYKITVAWTERPGHEPDTTLKIIDDYLKENGARVFDDTEADFDGYKEIMRSYEWTGGEGEFKILRRSANYILDVFAANQYEKFNISIFGNKKH